jgi:menaquinone-dependent protoporphyrinogen oxidase
LPSVIALPLRHGTCRERYAAAVAHVLIAYSTVDGQTRRICERLQRGLEPAHRVALMPVVDAIALDLAPFDTVVVGASIRYGKHRPHVFRFVERHAAELAMRRSAFFTVNVVARKPGKDTPPTNPYMRKFLKRVAWRPDALAVFAGRIDYAMYGPVDRSIIRFIMWLTKGPTAPDAKVEFTDWDRVDAFARELAALAPR